MKTTQNKGWHVRENIYGASIFNGNRKHSGPYPCQREADYQLGQMRDRWLNVHCPECGEQCVRLVEHNIADFRCDACGTDFDRLMKRAVKHPQFPSES